MAGDLDDDYRPQETPLERIARYWKKAAEAYRQACSAKSDEAKSLYIQMAMVWATLAHELERAPTMPPRHGHEERPKH